ncbi:MAG: ATP-binding protein [Bacteroidetes bacterium HGW-Bacteroidetes-21]|jgi:predicted HTH transcriptional regulator|nr:MAG: ATP-binding protein [Bacteroidetes bacterium HGW-Bacteroidetes-21]
MTNKEIINVEIYLTGLISKGEDLHTDFKFEISDSKKIARTFSAFANTDGGRLLVGVKDNGKIAGIRSEEEVFMVQGAASMYVKPKIKPEYKFWLYQKMQVLEVTIPKTKSTIYYAPDEAGKWKAYVRVKDENLLAPPVLEKIWKKQHSKGILLKYSVAESQLLSFLSERPEINVRDYTRLSLISDQEAIEILSDLTVLKVLTFKIESKGLTFRLHPAFVIEDYFK